MAGEANASWGSWLGWAGHLPGASLDLASTAVGTVSVWGLVSADYHRGGLSAACVLFYFFIITFIYLHVVGMCHTACWGQMTTCGS